MAESGSVIMGLLRDQPVAYRPDLARAVGSVKAGIMLSQALSHAENGGWFCKSQQEWEEETGLSRREQDTAMKKLRSLGVLEEKVRGIHRIIYYRVNMDKLVSLLVVLTEKEG
jgi:hypothetical protein